MSSFKRKTTSKETSLPVGTRALPAPIATFITSTGVPSLDDILGGGLPLSCDLLILAPDVHSAYGELLQKYFIVQGLSSGQDVCVIDDFAREFVSECMWIAGNDAQAAPSGVADEDVDEDINDPEAKIKIAWRYGQLKQFQTTVPSSFQSNGDFCRVFDLTTRIPTSLVEDSSSSGQLVYIDVNSASADAPCTRRILRQVELLLGAEVDTNGTVTRKPLRLCIPSLGSPQWDDLEPQEICSFFTACE